MEFVLEGITKVYKPGLMDRIRGRGKSAREALSGIDLRISTGMFGLLGPNGAGKTTLMRILATLLSPSAGRVLVDGRDLRECGQQVREMIGYLPQDFRGFPNLKVREFLDYSAVMRGMPGRAQRREAVETVIESTGLTEVRGRRLKKLSGGMHRRVGIAQALLGPPKLLIVDEPTVGLDPEERIRLRGELARIGMNCTIILSTHIVGDISSSCDRMAILDEGTIRFEGSPSDLLSEADGRTWEFSIREEELDAVKKDYQVVRTVAAGDGLRIRSVGDRPAREGVEAATPSLEDAYVRFMGGELALTDEGDSEQGGGAA